jgi:hydrogenase expression/formation protein HypD
MKHLDEYRDEKLANVLVDRLTQVAQHPWVLMEVCGGQTHTLVRYGIDDMLPAGMEMIHGPGCPVCVTPLEIIDKAITLALTPGVILASYGDMLRVPGSTTDLLHAKAQGAEVRMVYSPLDALKLARENPTREVVFFGIGFETTAPPNAAAVWQAARQGIPNFSLLASHVLVPPALRALLGAPGNRVQGLIAPGHVCAIVGLEQYEEIAREFQIPIVVGGFEPVDLLEAIVMLAEQLEQGRAEVENQYTRSVRVTGNPAAQRMLADVLEVCDRKWRGLGEIPLSGLKVRDKYAAWDAEIKFHLAPNPVEEPAECISSLILQGHRKPPQCPAFGIRCTPERPLGAPMVSSEGACAAYYQYRRHQSEDDLVALKGGSR